MSRGHGSHQEQCNILRAAHGGDFASPGLGRMSGMQADPGSLVEAELALLLPASLPPGPNRKPEEAL